MRSSSRVFISRSLQGFRASGIRFDADANVIAETDSKQYIGYSRDEVRAQVRTELKEIAGR